MNSGNAAEGERSIHTWKEISTSEYEGKYLWVRKNRVLKYVNFILF